MSFHNLAREYSTTTGTADAVLSGAVPGCNTWENAGVTNGETVRYGIITYDTQTHRPTHSEVGQGTYNTGTNTLARTTVESSTNGGAKIVMTGLSEVFITLSKVEVDAKFDDTGGTLTRPAAAPAAAANDKLKFYADRHINGLEEAFMRGSNMPALPLQRAIRYKPAAHVHVGATSFVQPFQLGGWSSVGGAAVTDDATFGLMVDFTAAAGANSAAGVRNQQPYFARGNKPFRGGFFAYSRVGLSDKTGLYFYLGFSSVNVLAAAGNADDPGGDYAMFQYSPTRGGAGDANFQFITRDNATQHLQDTGMAVTINKVYDFYIYCPIDSASIYWRIANLHDATEVSGTKTNNLPTATTNMYAILGVVNQAGGATRNLKFANAWFEPDDVDTP